MAGKKHERWNSRAVLWPCKDCGCEVSPVRNGKRHTWGVKNEAWKEAGMKVTKHHFTGEYLCFPCMVARIERRRGRKLGDMDCMRLYFPGGYTTTRWVSRKEWEGWLRKRRAQAET
jgi:hypothetical protein